MIEPVNDRLPVAADAVGGVAAVVLAIFAFLLTLLVSPVVAAVVGAVRAVGAIRETADRETLRSRPEWVASRATSCRW